MKNLVWLLFLPGFLCNSNPLKISPDSLVTWRGSCVVIPCQISRYKGADLSDISLLWYFQPYYDTNRAEYSGQLLYNSSSTSRKSRTRLQSASGSQLEFVGDLERKTCSLKISQVRTEDSGIYGARLFATYSPRVREKWFRIATVNVAETPPKPRMDISPEGIREGGTTVTCSIVYRCPEGPLRLNISGLGDRLSSQRTTISNGAIQTIVHLQMSWEDHGKSLICSLRRQDGSEISRSTMQLEVKYAPKGVQVISSPGTIIREGEMLSLECTIKSSNPEVSQYLWYKDDQLMDEWMYHKKIEFETKEDRHSGAYRCEAKNSAGFGKSEDLRIDVQYPPKEVRVERWPRGVIKEGEKVELQCSSRENPPISHYEWYKLPQTDVFRSSDRLYFNAIQLKNAGTYYCVANNSVGQSASPPDTLNVLYAPKGVQVISSPGTIIREGEMLSLECTIKSSNPEVSQYLWYKDNQLMDEWTNHKEIEFETKGDRHSGAYRCEAKNSAGFGKSEDLRIDVQSHSQDASVPATCGPEHTAENEGLQSSPSLLSTPEGVSSPVPSASSPPSLPELPPSGVPIPPLPSSQAPCDGRTLWEELGFLSESLDQVVKAQNQFMHSFQELTSVVVQLAEKFQEALRQKRQKPCMVPS